MIVLQREIPDFVNKAACKVAKEVDDKKRIIVLDMGGGNHEMDREILNYIDYVSPNSTELDTLFKSTIDQGDFPCSEDEKIW